MNKVVLASLVSSIFLAMATPALAYRGDPSVTGPNYDPSRHAAKQSAFATGDYNTWKSLQDGKGRVSQVVTASNFKEFAAAHENPSLWDSIRTKLGLGIAPQDGTGYGYGRTR